MKPNEREFGFRFIYGAFLGASIVFGLIIFLLKSQLSPEFLIYFSLLPFFLFVIVLHGTLAHYVKLGNKQHMIIYPVWMGGFYLLLLMLHILIILPLIYPDFSFG